MLVIRLSRTGRSKVPTYRIVVAEKTAAVKGRYQEIVGNYSPALATPELKYDKERVLYWVSQGAQPSETVARLLFRDGVEEMKKFYDANKKYQKKSKKASTEEEKQPDAAPAAEGDSAPDAEATSEAPAEEKKEEAPAEAPAEEKKEEAPAPEEKKEEAPAESVEEKKDDTPAEDTPAA